MQKILRKILKPFLKIVNAQLDWSVCCNQNRFFYHEKQLVLNFLKRAKEFQKPSTSPMYITIRPKIALHAFGSTPSNENTFGRVSLFAFVPSSSSSSSSLSIIHIIQQPSPTHCNDGQHWPCKTMARCRR